MAKQLAEVHDQALFMFDYDLHSIYMVIEQVCEKGQLTGVLDHIAVRRVATKQHNYKEWFFADGQRERANPYANVIPIVVTITPS